MGRKVIDILEELKDFKSNYDFVHYTDLHGLHGILSDKKIIGKLYYDKLNKGRNTEEISILRTSVDSTLKDPGKLTYKADGVKIFLDTKKITSTIRGVRKYPISEFSLSYMSWYKYRVNEFFYSLKDEYIEQENKKWIEREIKKTVENLLVGLRKEIGVPNKTKYDPHREIFKNGANNILNKMAFKSREDKLKQLDNLTNAIVYYAKYKENNREGEERLSFKLKNTPGIPLDKEYMKIKITKDFEDEKYDFSYFFTINRAEALLKNIVKNEKLFFIDNNYRSLLKGLSEYIRGAE